MDALVTTATSQPDILLGIVQAVITGTVSSPFVGVIVVIVILMVGFYMYLTKAVHPTYASSLKDIAAEVKSLGHELREERKEHTEDRLAFKESIMLISSEIKDLSRVQSEHNAILTDLRERLSDPGPSQKDCLI